MIRLHCKVQTYEWGKKGLDNLVAQAYLNQVPSIPESAELFDQAKEDTYAELWIGDHTNGPSQIIVDTHDEQLKAIINDQEFIHAHHGKEISIDRLFELNPLKFLGQAYLEQIGSNDAQFATKSSLLFKVLCIRKALSIQAHPNKSLAQQLHASHPEIYKDPNHKPEMAIALGGSEDFISYCGFAPAEVMMKNLKENPVLLEIFGPLCTNEQISSENLKDLVKVMFYKLDKDPEQLAIIITNLQNHILQIGEEERSLHQQLSLRLIEQYGYKDIGIIFTFFLNAIVLKEGECIALMPDEPHAYVQGDIMECMFTSDNVVRGGLTPKLKDVDTLVSMLKYENMNLPVLVKPNMPIQDSVWEYKSGFKEFRVFKILLGQKDQSVELKFNSFSFGFVVQGEGSIEMEEYGNFKLDQYNAYYIMPEKQFKIQNVGESPFLMFIANCDL